MKIDIELPPRKKRNTDFKGINVLVPGPKPNSRKDRNRVHIDLSKFYQLPGWPKEFASQSPAQRAVELLYFASLVYAIDRIFARKRAADGWTRFITVDIPISNAEAWTKLASKLEMLLGFLTGDIWVLSFSENPILNPSVAATNKLDFSDVCLFSGGADSLAGAIDLLTDARRKQERVLLIGHYDITGPREDQERLKKKIEEAYPTEFKLVQARIAPPRKASENTFRSRSFVFLSLGVYAAQTIGPTARLVAPENGPIALNIALTPSRSGSCSTRTMHPFFLEGFVDVLRVLGIQNEVINPFRFKTKGECLVDCSNRQLLESAIHGSVSCAHAQRAAWWIRKDALNCGYCLPCLVRRAALHRLGLDKGVQYGIDVLAGEPIGSEARSDFRAFLDFRRDGFSEARIERLIKSTATISNLTESVRVVKRGLEELNELLKANSWR